jgi:hypothetical protein
MASAVLAMALETACEYIAHSPSHGGGFESVRRGQGLEKPCHRLKPEAVLFVSEGSEM